MPAVRSIAARSVAAWVTACLLVLTGVTGPVHAVQPDRRPAATSFQLIYLHPRDREPVADRASAIQHVAEVVDTWLTEQLDGRSPRFVADGTGRPTVLTIRSTLSARAIKRRTDLVYDVMKSWRTSRIVKPGVLPIVFIDGTQKIDACAWEWDGVRGPYISFPVGNCDIYPSLDEQWPDYASYVLAHEMVHALGAVDRRAPHEDGTFHIAGEGDDLMFGGGWDEVDWENLALDPGRDDYYLTGRADLVNIEDSPLLER